MVKYSDEDVERILRTQKEPRNEVESIAELARRAEERRQMWFAIDDTLRANGYAMADNGGVYYVGVLLRAGETKSFYNITDAIRYALTLLTETRVTGMPIKPLDPNWMAKDAQGMGISGTIAPSPASGFIPLDGD